MLRTRVHKKLVLGVILKVYDSLKLIFWARVRSMFCMTVLYIDRDAGIHDDIFITGIRLLRNAIP